MSVSLLKIETNVEKICYCCKIVNSNVISRIGRSNCAAAGMDTDENKIHTMTELFTSLSRKELPDFSHLCFWYLKWLGSHCGNQTEEEIKAV